MGLSAFVVSCKKDEPGGSTTANGCTCTMFDATGTAVGEPIDVPANLVSSFSTCEDYASYMTKGTGITYKCVATTK
ncbi:MAG: hypothetical protein FWD66_01620 [Paludibacter sp.]|nr:hypothetical protein [Paludibacter sp.]